MTTRPIVPARLEFDANGLPYSSRYGDVYHPLAGPYAQADNVFIAGNGLPERWRGRDRFVVLETGFGLGNNFLALWDAWQSDPQRCEQLHFISIEQHPLSRDDLVRAHAASPFPDTSRALIEAWPPPTPNLHRLAFADGRVQLLLMLGDTATSLRECVARVDAFLPDGFSPAKNHEMWDERIFKSLARLAAPDATLATWTAARAVRDGLTGAGFEVQLGAARGGKRDITLARFAPRFVRPREPLRDSPRAIDERRALVIGAGLAGCSVAAALAELGWHSVVIDRHDAPAREASGNPGGLFHGIVNPQDGMHARFNRAAALEATRAARRAIERHGVAGSVAGLLRLHTASSDIGSMRATLSRLGLPESYVRAIDADEASAMCGVAVRHPCWFYPGGGWIDPAGLCRAYLEQAGPKVQFRGGVTVDRLERRGTRWQLLDAQGAVVDEAQTIVLANAGDALRLLGADIWPIEPVRGQISLLPASRLSLPHLPISGAGYLLPAVNGQAVFGATSHPGDMDASVRASDHVDNLSRLALLRGTGLETEPHELHGRTAWRWASRDRLPVVGAVPERRLWSMNSDRPEPETRLDQPRFVPRESGLFICAALGSRGITWSALAGQVLAASVSGAPMPLEACLLDAIDPARFVSRAARRSAVLPEA